MTPKAIRVTNDNVWGVFLANMILFVGLDVLLGDILVYRKHDVVKMSEEIFNANYTFVGPEDPFGTTYVRVLPKKQLLGKKGRRK